MTADRRKDRVEEEEAGHSSGSSSGAGIHHRGPIRDIIIDNSAEIAGGSPSPENDIEISSEIALKNLHLTFMQKIVIGSGHILNDLCASLWFSYLLLYFQNVVKLSSDYAAYLMLVGQVRSNITTTFLK